MNQIVKEKKDYIDDVYKQHKNYIDKLSSSLNTISDIDSALSKKKGSHSKKKTVKIILIFNNNKLSKEYADNLSYAENAFRQKFLNNIYNNLKEYKDIETTASQFNLTNIEIENLSDNFIDNNYFTYYREDNTNKVFHIDKKIYKTFEAHIYEFTDSLKHLDFYYKRLFSEIIDSIEFELGNFIDKNKSNLKEDNLGKTFLKTNFSNKQIKNLYKSDKLKFDIFTSSSIEKERIITSGLRSSNRHLQLLDKLEIYGLITNANYDYEVLKKIYSLRNATNHAQSLIYEIFNSSFLEKKTHVVGLIKSLVNDLCILNNNDFINGFRNKDGEKINNYELLVLIKVEQLIGLQKYNILTSEYSENNRIGIYYDKKILRNIKNSLLSKLIDNRIFLKYLDNPDQLNDEEINEMDNFFDILRERYDFKHREKIFFAGVSPVTHIPIISSKNIKKLMSVLSVYYELISIIPNNIYINNCTYKSKDIYKRMETSRKITSELNILEHKRNLFQEEYIKQRSIILQ